MKLRDKKTGAIYSIDDIDLGNNKDGIWLGMTLYKSLAELNDEWEDYEEPKEFWYIYGDGCLQSSVIDSLPQTYTDRLQEVGNYFETEEEAEKAVEKLKAWKRLKDMGFKIKGIRYRNYKNYIEWDISQKVSDDNFTGEDFNDALHLLFGGEE